ncbi:MAG TPA: hypothetical protein VFZ42_08410 [Chitinophagaceae bacterium]
MNRKAREKESPRKSGPEHAGYPSWSDPSLYLEYENIPDPISFDDTLTGSIQKASNNGGSDEERKLSGSRR